MLWYLDSHHLPASADFSFGREGRFYDHFTALDLFNDTPNF